MWAAERESGDGQASTVPAANKAVKHSEVKAVLVLLRIAD